MSPWKRSQSNPGLAALNAHSHCLHTAETQYSLTHPVSAVSYRELTQEKTQKKKYLSRIPKDKDSHLKKFIKIKLTMEPKRINLS